MNAERLHVILSHFQADLKRDNTLSVFENLAKSLEQQVQQPNQPNHQQQVAKHLKNLYQILSESETNEFSPSWKQTMEEIGLSRFIGDTLKGSIEKILERNSITLAVAAEELTVIVQELKAASAAADQVIAGFKQLNVGAEELGQGECELAILVPRAAVDNSLFEYGREVIRLTHLVGVFSEISMGEKPPLTIRTVSSCDFSILLELAPQVGAFIADAVSYVLQAYAALIVIREHRSKMKEAGLPDEGLVSVDQWADSHMTRKIDELVDQLLDEYSVTTDQGRANELKTGLRQGLSTIAKKIDNGYNFDVRIEPIISDLDLGEDAEEPEYVAKIQAASEHLKFIKTSGDPILSIPEMPDPVDELPE